MQNIMDDDMGVLAGGRREQSIMRFLTRFRSGSDAAVTKEPKYGSLVPASSHGLKAHYTLFPAVYRHLLDDIHIYCH